MISALHDPHRPALQFQRRARSPAWTACTRWSTSRTTSPSSTVSETPLSAYHVTADPVIPGVTGSRFFGTNVDHVIYEHTETFGGGKMPDTGPPPLGAEMRGMVK